MAAWLVALNFEIMIRISHFVDVERTNLLRFGHSTELLSALRIRNVDAGIWHARRDQKVARPVG